MKKGRWRRPQKWIDKMTLQILSADCKKNPHRITQKIPRPLVSKETPWWFWRKREARRRRLLDDLLAKSTPAERVKIQAARKADGGKLRKAILAV